MPIAALTFITFYMLATTAGFSWWISTLVKRLKALEASGLEVEGEITQSRVFKTRSGKNLSIRYRFQGPAMDEVEGCTNIPYTEEKAAAYPAGNKQTILYLQEKPEVNVLKAELAARMANVEKLRKTVVPMAFTSVITIAIAWFAALRHHHIV